MNKKLKYVLVLSLLGNLAIGYIGYKAYTYRTHINYWLERYDHAIAEFSGREEHRAANDALGVPSPDVKRLVFFGTQVISNWDVGKYFPDFETINRGVDSQRVAGYLLRFRPDAIDLSPTAVVIEISSYNFRPNVTTTEIRDYVVSMVELAVANNIVPILCTIIPPTSDFTVYEHPDYHVRDTVAAFSAWLAAYTGEHELPLADFRGAVTGADGYLRPELATTQVDLNGRGYDAIAEALRYALDRI